MSEQALQELNFIIAGEAFRQVRAWQEASDQAVIRANLERRGIAQVILVSGRPAGAGGYYPGGSHPAGKREPVETVRKMPEPGQARPFYGPQGGGYRYTFEGCPAGEAQVGPGCRLRVENTALERFKTPGYAPLELELGGTAGPQAPPGDGSGGESGATPEEAVLDPEDPQVVRKLKAALEGGGRRVTELRFVIDADLLKKLAAWPHWGKEFAAYGFIFRPLSTGTEIGVRHQVSGEKITLGEG